MPRLDNTSQAPSRPKPCIAPRGIAGVVLLFTIDTLLQPPPLQSLPPPQWPRDQCPVSAPRPLIPSLVSGTRMPGPRRSHSWPTMTSPPPSRPGFSSLPTTPGHTMPLPL
ncbi:hypothetical protein F5883DRAFT_579996 [Diaporthe sp. PMI_573]|nr:hypothetical protein F5883DRAFT_579996 [Diaporthaceae sp. PMI_573]